jgi:DNA-binding response OmpR family regulator
MKVLTRDAVEFLLIDDDPAITKFLVTYLKQKGHTCEFLTEGFKTAAWLEFHRCDVAVVDLNMPKVDGISLISFIREMSQTLPIIVFTGVGYDEERMHAALRAGANGYVSKNLPIEQLYCVLSRVLAPCQQRARNRSSQGLPKLGGQISSAWLHRGATEALPLKYILRHTLPQFPVPGRRWSPRAT